MIPGSRRRARAAPAVVLCAAMAAPGPAAAALLAAPAAEIRVAAPALPPTAAAAALAPMASSLAVAPSLAAAAAPSAAFAPAPAALAAPAAAAPDSADAPAASAAAAPALTPAPSDRSPRERLRSAAKTISAAATLTLSALTGGGRPPLDAAFYLRENQDYAQTTRRASLSDGSVVVVAAKTPPYRVGLTHPALQRLLTRADAIKASGPTEEARLAAVRALVRETLPGGADAVYRALTLRRARAGKALELGDYAAEGRGTDRESALLANLALQRAGFKPKLVILESAGVERLANLVHTSRGQVVFDADSDAFSGRRLQDLTTLAPGGAALAELDGPRVFSPAGKPKTAGVTARVPGPSGPIFEVMGRSAAERLFKEEESRRSPGSPEETAPVEWLYLPFYADGHTVLRVGDRVYDFGRQGWRVHAARAFLFNNPYFDAQFARHRAAGMPPFSLGVPFQLPRAAVEKLVADIERERAAHWPWFSFWFNNCNQRLLRLMHRSGIWLPGAFTRFSSIRSFRTMLLTPPPQAGAPRLYPLPSPGASAEPFGASIPRELYVPRSTAWDVLVFMHNWPRYLLEKLAHLRRLRRSVTAPKS